MSGSAAGTENKRWAIGNEWQKNGMVSEFFRNIVVVGAGSFIGGAARYLVSLLMK